MPESHKVIRLVDLLETENGETIIIKKDSEPAKPETQSGTPISIRIRIY